MDQSVRTFDQWGRTVNRVANMGPNHRYVDSNNGAYVNKSKYFNATNTVNLGTLVLRNTFHGVEVQDYMKKRKQIVLIERGEGAYNFKAYRSSYPYRVYVDARSQNGSIYVSVYDGNSVVGRYTF